MVLRLLLSDPSRSWRLRDLAAAGVSAGHVINVIDALAKRQWVRRGTAWRSSFVQLTKPQELLSAWTNAYHFDWNWTAWYRSEKKNLFPHILRFLTKKKIRYALTLFTASTIIAPYVVNAGVNLYLDADVVEGEDILQSLEGTFQLAYPGEGGILEFHFPFTERRYSKHFKH